MNYPRVITTLQHTVTINIDIIQHADDVFDWETQNGKFGSGKTFPSAAKALDNARKYF